MIRTVILVPNCDRGIWMMHCTIFRTSIGEIQAVTGDVAVFTIELTNILSRRILIRLHPLDCE